jgi:hypothetical protein
VLPKTCVETSVISYLTARPSRDEIAAAHQRLTRDWWDRKKRLDIYVSELVVQEASRGDAVEAMRSRRCGRGACSARGDACCRDAGFEPPIVCTPQELMEN